MKVSKSTRATAAHICQVMASNDTWTSDIATHFGIPRRGAAMMLAKAARLEALFSHNWTSFSREHWAEAEAMLRCGWSL